MFKETAGKVELLLTSLLSITIKYEKTSAVRSRISSNLIFASSVGYFDRAYYGFFVISSRMFVLIERNKI